MNVVTGLYEWLVMILVGKQWHCVVYVKQYTSYRVTAYSILYILHNRYNVINMTIQQNRNIDSTAYYKYAKMWKQFMKEVVK